MLPGHWARKAFMPKISTFKSDLKLCFRLRNSKFFRNCKLDSNKIEPVYKSKEMNHFIIKRWMGNALHHLYYTPLTLPSSF